MNNNAFSNFLLKGASLRYLAFLSFGLAISLHFFRYYHNGIVILIIGLSVLFGLHAMGSFKNSDGLMKRLVLRGLLLSILPFAIFQKMNIQFYDLYYTDGISTGFTIIALQLFMAVLIAAIFWVVPFFVALVINHLLHDNTSRAGAVVTTFTDAKSLESKARGEELDEKITATTLRYMWGQTVVGFMMFSLLLIAYFGNIEYYLPFFERVSIGN